MPFAIFKRTKKEDKTNWRRKWKKINKRKTCRCFYMFVNGCYHLWEASVYKLENRTIASNWEKKRKNKNMKWRPNRIAHHSSACIFYITSDVRLAFFHEMSKKKTRSYQRRPKWTEKKSYNVSFFESLIYRNSLSICVCVCERLRMSKFLSNFRRERTKRKNQIELSVQSLKSQ